MPMSTAIRRSAIRLLSKTRWRRATDKAYAEEIRGRIDKFKAGVSKDLMPKGMGESKRDDALFDHRR